MAVMLNAASRARKKAAILRIPLGLRQVALLSLEVSAGEMVLGMKAAAGEDEGDLIASIRHEPLAEDEGIGVRIMAGGPLTTRPTRPAHGGSPMYDYALAQEHGTERMPAHPFFFPTYRRLKPRARRRVTSALKKALTDAAKGV